MPRTDIYNDGPYSGLGLFDYKAEVAREEAKQAQLAESEKKIMRTNAVGDIFRLLIDGIGGSKGATITQKGVNPGIIRASGRLAYLQDKSDNNLERLRMTDMANKSRDVAYNQRLAEESRANKNRLDAENRDNARDDKKIADENILYDKRAKDKRTEEIADQGVKRAETLTDQDTAQKNRITAQDNSAKNARDTNKQYLADQAVVLSGGSIKRDRSIAVKGDIPFVIPGTQQTIYINPLEIQKIMPLLIGGKNKWDQSLDAAQKALMTNDAIKDGSALLTLTKNWDAVKGFFIDDETTTQPTSIKPDKDGITDVSSIFN